MSSAHEDEDLKPSETAGYKPSQANLSPEEFKKLDAEDESLNRWKASLGLNAAAGADTNGPKVTVLSLELISPTLPAGKVIRLDLTDTTHLADIKKNPVTIKEGVEYNVRITFKVNHSIISVRYHRSSIINNSVLKCTIQQGVRYLQVVKRAGVKVDKLEQMLGSYGPSPDPYTKNFESEESPSGLLARSGAYSVRSRVVDDDKEVYCDFEWSFKLAKEW